LKFESYKYQLLQHLTAKVEVVHYIHCPFFISRFEDEKFFTVKIVFGDEATFHLLGNVKG
jgi:hypothetical protein